MSDARQRHASAPGQEGRSGDELAYRLRQQEITSAAGLFALRTHDLGLLFQEATELCAEGLQTRFCKLLKFLPEENQFLVVAGVGWRAGIVGHARTGADLESPAGYAFKTGKPVISNHLGGETRFRTPDILAEHGIRRAINVIVRSGGEPFGVLEVDSPIEGRFSNADLSFMQGVANLLGVAIDRQQVEDSLRKKEEELQQALEHQELLTQEISHRVKNSLQLVGSFLSLQARDTDDAALRRSLGEAEARVQVVAQVHDHLWRRESVHSVDLAEFLGALCQQLRVSAGEHVLACELPSVTIAVDQAVPLGLLVNELVTNALKYAYPDGSGEVCFSVSRESAGNLRVEVSDRGAGLPSDLDASRSKSLGLRLINNLAQQLGGAPEWSRTDPGTRFVLTFPLRA